MSGGDMRNRCSTAQRFRSTVLIVHSYNLVSAFCNSLSSRRRAKSLIFADGSADVSTNSW